MSIIDEPEAAWTRLMAQAGYHSSGVKEEVCVCGVCHGGYPTLIMFQIISLESSRCRLSAILAAGTPSEVFST